MKQDEIIEMTRRLGICELTSKPKQSIHYSLTIHQMEDFAKLVAAKEREACAKTCEELTFSKAGPSHDALRQRLLCAEAIRARGEA